MKKVKEVGRNYSSLLDYNDLINLPPLGLGSVTSVGMSVPSAFSITGSPITTSGTLALTGAGTISQYIRGDGTLGTLPTGSGGGSSVSYYLNGGTSQGTIGGNAYKEMSKIPVIGTGVDFSIGADGYVANFITDPLDPSLLLIPGGNWLFDMFFSASSSGGTPQFYVELYKYDGTTLTSIASSSSIPENITSGTSIDLYTTALAVPTTTLTLTDRLAVRVYVIHSGRTITLHTQDSHLCEIVTTFSTGLNALNGLTDQVQYFAVGTSGTDFAISSATNTHTFNLPTASASKRGALSSGDWTIFNNKQATISLTTTGSSGSSTFVTNTLNIPTYTLAGLGGFANPMTTLGDSVYGGASGAVTRLAGNTTTAKQYLSQTGTGTISAAPIWATIAGADITGAALTKVDDTNVTITLGGTPTTALLRATSITLGWTGTLADGRIASASTWNAKQSAITLTTTGSSGASTFVTNTLNIPTYTLAGLGGITLTSLSSSATGLTYTNTTGVFSITSGYAIPTTASQTTWDSAYTNRITSLTTTGSSGSATLVSNVLNIPTYTLAGLGGLSNPMTTLGDSIYGGASGAVTRLAGNITTAKQYLSQTGTGTISAAPIWATIAGADITGAALTKVDDTNVTITLGGTPTTALLRAASITLGWTGTLADARITSAATWNAKESALTFTAPLSRSTNTISIPAATTSVNGYLTSTDWTTFNGKFTLPALTNGSVLFSNGTTIAQDNAQFFWDNTNNRLGIGTATPANNLDVVRGTAGTMARGFYESASVSYNADTKFGIYTASATATDGAALYLGQTNLLNASSQYGGFELQYRYNSSTTENLRINYVSRLATGAVSTSAMDLFTLSKTGVATFVSTIQATGFKTSAGTSGQLFSADGGIVAAGTNITISGGFINATGGGGGTDFYTTNGTLTSTRTITGATFDLIYNDNKNGIAQVQITNTTAGASSASNLLLTSDASSGNARFIKYSSTNAGSAIVGAGDLALVNYTAGNIVLLNAFATGDIEFGVGSGTSALMTLKNDGHLLIGTTTNSTYHLDVNGDANANKINLAAGTLTRCPLDFTPASAVLKTTPIAGDTEVSADGKLYYTHNTSERGVVDAFQFYTPNANISLTAQTAAQKIFNTITNGAITLKAATNYKFEMMLQITGMAASGTFGFANGGAATFSNIIWWSNGIKGASTTAATFQSTYNTSFTNAALVTATAVTSGYVHIVGKFRVLAAGTFIPQITFSAIPTTPVIVAGSYFKISAISDNLTDRIGNWS